MAPLAPSTTRMPLHLQVPASEVNSMPVSLLLNFPTQIITTMFSTAPIQGQYFRQWQKTSRLHHIPRMATVCTVKDGKRALLATTRACRRIWWQVYRTYVVFCFFHFHTTVHSEKHYRAPTPPATMVLNNTTTLAENEVVLPVALKTKGRAPRSGSGKAAKSKKKPGK